MKWRFVYRGFKARYRDQRSELRALIAALRPDDIAVDVGANKGSYLWSLSHAVPDGRVVAFEPQPVLSAYLTLACRATGLTNVVVEAAGVSARSGQLTLAIPGSGDSSTAASFEAPVRQHGEFRTGAPDYCNNFIMKRTKGHQSHATEGCMKNLLSEKP